MEPVLSVKIFRDESPVNPRKEFDHLGHIVYWGRYDIGDEKVDRESWAEDMAYEFTPQIAYWQDRYEYAKTEEGEVYALAMKEKAIINALKKHLIILPISYNESMGDIFIYYEDDFIEPDGDGWIFVTNEDVLKAFRKKKMTKKTRERAINCLKAEIEELSRYSTGEVYGFEVMQDGKHVDSCWGFYEEPESVLKIAVEGL